MASSTGASPRLWKWMKRAVLPDSEANCWVVRRERASLGKKGSGHLICWSLVLSSMLSLADEPRPKTKKSRECRFCTWRPLTVWFGWYRLCMGCGRGASVVFQTSSDLSRIKRLKIVLIFGLARCFIPKSSIEMVFLALCLAGASGWLCQSTGWARAWKTGLGGSLQQVTEPDHPLQKESGVECWIESVACPSLQFSFFGQRNEFKLPHQFEHVLSLNHWLSCNKLSTQNVSYQSYQTNTTYTAYQTMVFAATGVQQFLVMARHRWICHMICLWHLWHSPCVLRPPFGATAGSSCRSMRVTRVHQTLCRFAHWQLRSGPLTSSRLGASHAVQCSSTNLTMSADVSWWFWVRSHMESYYPTHWGLHGFIIIHYANPN